jgi:hypothetical protein
MSGRSADSRQWVGAFLCLGAPGAVPTLVEDPAGLGMSQPAGGAARLRSQVTGHRSRLRERFQKAGLSARQFGLEAGLPSSRPVLTLPPGMVLSGHFKGFAGPGRSSGDHGSRWTKQRLAIGRSLRHRPGPAPWESPAPWGRVVSCGQGRSGAGLEEPNDLPGPPRVSAEEMQ